MGKKQLLMTPKAVSDRKYAAKKAHERKRRREAAAALAATLTIADGVSMPVQDPAQLTIPEAPAADELLAAEAEQAAAAKAVELEIAEDDEDHPQPESMAANFRIPVSQASRSPLEVEGFRPINDGPLPDIAPAYAKAPSVTEEEAKAVALPFLENARLESELAEMKKGFEYAVTVREVFRDRLALLSHEASKVFGFAIDCTQETEVGPEESGIAKILSQVRHLKTGIESKEKKLEEEKANHVVTQKLLNECSDKRAEAERTIERLNESNMRIEEERANEELAKRDAVRALEAEKSANSTLRNSMKSLSEKMELDELKTNAWIGIAIVLAMALAASLFY